MPDLAVSILTDLTTLTLVLTASEWIHGRSCYFPSHGPHLHSGPIDMAGCEWIHDRSTGCVTSHCPQSGSVDLTQQAVSNPCQVPTVVLQLIVLTPTLASYWFDSKWVITCQIQLCFISLSSPPLLFCWLGRLWVVIPCQFSLCSFSLTSGPVNLTASEWFHAMSAVYLLTILPPTLVLLAWQQVSGSIPGPAIFLTVLISTLLAEQFVSDSMLGSIVFLLTILIPTLVLLTW